MSHPHPTKVFFLLTPTPVLHMPHLHLTKVIFLHVALRQVPVWYTTNVAANRFGVCMGAWFTGNLVINQLTQTHAFEIYADGQLVFSKLQAGRLPSLNELLSGLDAALGSASGELADE